MKIKSPHTAGMPAYRGHIAFLCFSRSLGGLELSTLRIATAMSARGVRVTLIVPPDSPLELRARESRLDVVPLAPRWKYGDLPAAIQLAKVLNDKRVNIVILMQSKDVHLAAIASLRAPHAKLVFYQQMMSGHDKRDLLHTWMYSRLSLWISLTQGMKNNVLALTRMPHEKVTIVPLGTDLGQFDPRRYKKSETRRFFRLPRRGRIIGVLGRLDAQKGQELLLRAVPEVIQKHSDARFVIAGDETAGEPGYKLHLQKLARDFGIEQYVRFLPFTEDVPRLMAALDVFVLPSFAETYGLVVIEAMAMELPVIATNAGGVPEIITNGRTGLLVEPRNPGAIARAIDRILSNVTFRASLARAARVEALRKYDFDVCVDSLLASLAMI
jgi:glycosyltransferase involved in cell wall biosynthesis